MCTLRNVSQQLVLMLRTNDHGEAQVATIFINTLV
jgi:hypothetical protein